MVVYEPGGRLSPGTKFTSTLDYGQQKSENKRWLIKLPSHGNLLQQAKLRQEGLNNVKMKLSVRMADRQGRYGREVKEKYLERRMQLWNHV